MSTKQPHSSPILLQTTASSASSSTASSSWTTPAPALPHKKFRFRRRRRQTGALASDFLLLSKSVSSFSLGDSSTQSSASTSGISKKRSLLSRFLKRSGRSHHSKKTTMLVVDSHTQELHNLHIQPQQQQQQPQQEERNSDNVHSVSNEEEQRHQEDDNDDTARREEEEEATRLLQSGLEERQAGQLEAALMTWTLALDVLSCPGESRPGREISCRMVSLLLKLYRTTAEESHLDQASCLIASFKDASADADCAQYLDGTPLLLDLLMQQSCWSVALQVTHKLLSEVEPVILARLHLEVALLESDKHQQRRSFQLSHLSECHQLLLTFDLSSATKDNANFCQSLWQELAQAYGMLGEEELALGCSRSRLQHLTSTKDIAFGHYEHALMVHSPVGQYSLALKETELALETLCGSAGASRNNGGDNSEREHRSEEDEEVELLWMKLYQFKADLLCRMGRIGDSIQNYKILLELDQKSHHRGPVDAANVLYILGKLSVRNKEFQAALGYFTEELQMTKSVVGNTHLAISKILHELARVADAGLMDFPLAVQYYQEALQVERGVYQQCKRQQQEQRFLSADSAALMNDANMQMGETKQNLGKLHFKLGDFNRAVTLAVDK